jgi:hypothetical protein
MTFLLNKQSDKFSILEAQIQDIRMWLNNVNNLDNVKIGVNSVTETLKQLKDRVTTLEANINSKIDTSNYATTDQHQDLTEELARIQELLDSIIKDVLGPESQIAFNENTGKYEIKGELLINRINSISSTLEELKTKFYIINQHADDMTQYSNVSVVQEVLGGNKVTLSGKIILKGDNDSINFQPDGKTALTMRVRNDDLWLYEENSTDNDARDILFPRGLRFYINNDGNVPKLVIRLPGEGTANTANSHRIQPNDIVLYFGHTFSGDGNTPVVGNSSTETGTTDGTAFSGQTWEEFDSNHVKNPNWMPNYPWWVNGNTGELMNAEEPSTCIQPDDWISSPPHGDGYSYWVENDAMYNYPIDS